MSFQDEVLSNLSIYRKVNLGIDEPGVFRYRGNDLIKEHILPIKYKSHNIIQGYRDDFFNSPDSNINFHMYFHHLNSSQALCVNLFYPLLLEGKLDLIFELLEIPQSSINEACFEKESDVENTLSRKTSFDYFMRLADNTKIYFEIKYTEAEFGKANNDEEHREKFSTTYLPLLKNNIYIKEEYHNVSAFLNSYQILRNLCHLSENSYVIFLYPKRNKKINEQATNAIDNILTKKGRDKFKILYLEPTIETLLKNVESNRLKNHYNEFIDKYINLNATY